MDHRMQRKGIFAVILSATIVASVVGAPVSSLGSIGIAAGASSPETVQATDHVAVWERAGLPLRASTTNAEDTVTNPSLFVNYKPEGTGPVDARKSQTSVYGTGTSISLTFESVTGADTTQYNGHDTQLVIARLEPNESQDLSAFEMPADLDEASELLTPENANTNASFTVKDTAAVTNGDVSTSFTPSESGVYVLFLATNETGKSGSFSDPNNNLSVSGNVTIIGSDTVIVQQNSGSVSPSKSSVNRGNSIDFQVDRPAGSSVNHTVIVYKESTWTSAEFELVVQKQISADMNESDFKLKHSISTVEGVADFDGPVTVMGTTFNDEHFDGSTSTPSILDFVVEKANNKTSGHNLSDVETQATGSDTLYASATGVAEADGTQTLTIQTKSSWSTGEYRWVYLGGGRDDSDIYTQTGTVEVNKPSSGTSGSNTGGGDDGGTQVPSDGTAEPVPTDEGATVNFKNIQEGQTVSVTLPEEATTSDLGGMTGLDITMVSSVGDFSIDVTPPAADPPSGTPPIDGSVGYFQINHDVPDEAIASAEITFTVSNLPDDTTPEEVVLYRYHDGEWQELETRHLGNNQFVATTPGFSVFAIGKKSQQTATPTKTATPTPTQTPPATEMSGSQTPPPTGTPEQPGGGFPWVIVLVVVGIVGAVVVYFRDEITEQFENK